MAGQWFIEGIDKAKIELTYKRGFSQVTSPFKNNIKIFGVFIY